MRENNGGPVPRLLDGNLLGVFFLAILVPLLRGDEEGVGLVRAPGGAQAVQVAQVLAVVDRVLEKHLRHLEEGQP